MDDQTTRGERFRALHEGEPFVIPNPWDAGSARVLEGLGFAALATTSSAFAFTLGRSDGEVTLDELVGARARAAARHGLPVSVDLENGFGAAPEDAARAIARAAEAGAVGGSIEDWDPDGGLYEPRPRGRARGRRGRGRPRAGLPVHADRARREPHPRQPRPRRHDRAPAGLRGRGRRRALRARAARAPTRSARSARRSGRPVNVLALAGPDARARSPARARSGSASAARCRGRRVTAFAAAAEAIRDRGDFSVLRLGGFGRPRSRGRGQATRRLRARSSRPPAR